MSAYSQAGMCSVLGHVALMDVRTRESLKSRRTPETPSRREDFEDWMKRKEREESVRLRLRGVDDTDAHYGALWVFDAGVTDDRRETNRYDLENRCPSIRFVSTFRKARFRPKDYRFHVFCSISENPEFCHHSVKFQSWSGIAQGCKRRATFHIPCCSNT